MRRHEAVAAASAKLATVSKIARPVGTLSKMLSFFSLMGLPGC
jgi:hypothetical protein